MKLFGFTFGRRQRDLPVEAATRYLEPSPGLTTAETMAELKKLKGTGIKVLSHRKPAVKKYAAKKTPMKKSKPAPFKKGMKKK